MADDLETNLTRLRDETVAVCEPSLSPSDLDWLGGRISAFNDVLATLRGEPVEFPRVGRGGDGQVPGNNDRGDGSFKVSA